MGPTSGRLAPGFLFVGARPGWQIPSPGRGVPAALAGRPWAVAPKLMHLTAGLGRVAGAWAAGFSDSELLVVVGEVGTARAAQLRGRPIYRRHRRIRRRPFRIDVEMWGRRVSLQMTAEAGTANA